MVNVLLDIFLHLTVLYMVQKGVFERGVFIPGGSP
jgi:hypothetical protein